MFWKFESKHFLDATFENDIKMYRFEFNFKWPQENSFKKPTITMPALRYGKYFMFLGNISIKRDYTDK